MNRLGAHGGIFVILQRFDDCLAHHWVLIEFLQRVQGLDAHAGIAVQARRCAYRSQYLGIRATRVQHVERVHANAGFELSIVPQNKSQRAEDIGIVR